MTEVSVRFFGGPLDGRVQALGDSEPVRGSVMRHVHLHDGPKIETHYRLGYTPENGWEYRLCGLATPEVDEV
ncbi:hypothetical protein FPZ12_005210 [Amycolatopsis acidicola]|uniref:Uncharacterized protein n=1 Tax=Amycolatopsis acidicola TaxID=2596893 RepID=A0A5N0VGJ5_9PSEU|nr:hypothetical protein [Amycolatopsis acidicola]KAA9165477.1 hypothetical protein FPZ12_005210 [Amycolatopsis acidicola]